MTIRLLALRAATALAAAVLVAGCGGGNSNEAGSSTAFNIAPTSLNLSGPDGDTCAGPDPTDPAAVPLFAGRIFVYGGAGPYRVQNSQPLLVGLSTTVVPRSGDSFDVFYLTRGCLDPVTVIVVDQIGRQQTLTLRSTPGED
jgi:hypothetical protein